MFRRQAKPVLAELAAMRAELEAAQAEQVGEKAADITMQRLWNEPEMSGSITADVLAELERILGAAMTSVAAEFAKQGLRLSWDVFDQEAQKFAESYGYNLIKQINESTQRQIGQAISSWIGKPAGFPDLVEDIRRIMPARAVQPGIRDRARLIAQTETTRVYAESRQAALASEGLERSRWRTAEDEIVCPYCAPLGNADDGDGALGVNGKFADPVTGTQIDGPPRHPGCRCWLVADTEELDARIQAQEDVAPQPVEPKRPPKPVLTEAEQARKKMDKIEATYRKRVADIDAQITASHAEDLPLSERLWNIADMNSPEGLAIQKQIQEIWDRRSTLYDKKFKILDGISTAQRKALKVDNPLSIKPNIDSAFPASLQQRTKIEKGFKEFGNLVELPGTDHARVFVGYTESGRAYHQSGVGIFLDTGMAERTTVHELGHWLEDTKPGLKDKARQFLRKRTFGEEPRRLKDITGNSGYSDGEFTRVDKFMDPYMGKVYETSEGTVRSTEIISMGLEQFYADAGEFAKRDPEYFDFIYTVVRGVIES